MFLKVILETRGTIFPFESQEVQVWSKKTASSSLYRGGYMAHGSRLRSGPFEELRQGQRCSLV